MPKIFFISPHRNMTRACIRLMQFCQIDTMHGPHAHLPERYEGHEDDPDYIFKVIKPLTDAHDALADVPIPAIYEQLYFNYPGAKFVLVHRNPFAWVRSVRKMVKDRDFTMDEKALYWRYFPSQPVNANELSDKQMVWMYAEHFASVITFFKDQNADEQLLVVDIDDIECGETICRFVGSALHYDMPYVTD